MTKKIGIVGSGVAGLHLAYALKEHFQVTVFEQRSVEKIKKGRVSSTQAHVGPTRLREQRFGFPDWGEDHLIKGVRFNIGNQFFVSSSFDHPAASVDQRIYFARCIEDLSEKGVTFHFDKAKDLQSLVEEFDLVIDCTGKKGPLFQFPKIEELSPCEKPLRKHIVGYFKGVKQTDPITVSFSVLPGIGEFVEVPALTEHGQVTILFALAIPKQNWDVFTGIKTGEAFTAKMKELVQEYLPDIGGRIDEQKFELCDENGFLQTSFIPVVRRPYTFYQDRLVLGCGDSVTLNDPLTAQGSNLASYSAEQLYETLQEYREKPWDEEVGQAYWERIKGRVTAVTEWTNQMAQSIPEHVIQLFYQAKDDPALAKKIAHWFDNPEEAHQAFMTT